MVAWKHSQIHSQVNFCTIYISVCAFHSYKQSEIFYGTITILEISENNSIIIIIIIILLLISLLLSVTENLELIRMEEGFLG